MRCSSTAFLLVLLLLASSSGPASASIASAISNAAHSVSSFFGGDSETNQELQSGDPVLSKTAQALYFMLTDNETALAAATLLFGPAEVVVKRTGQHQVYLIFQAPAQPANAEPERVPFLHEFVYTSEGPAPAVDLFTMVAEGPYTQGSLADAVEEVMGDQPVLHVVCTGEGDGAANLAALCGPWAGLQFPLANVDVMTFGGFGGKPLAGFNTQFTWSFDQLTTLFYFWPWTPADAKLGQGQQAPQSIGAAMSAIQPLVTQDSLAAASYNALTNLPPQVPPQYASGEASQDELDGLAPIGEPDLELPPSDCPVILCKTRIPVTASCLIFGDGGMESQLQGLPKQRLHAASGADAVVAWNASSQSAIILWEGSESNIDWLQDAIVVNSGDFRPGNLSAMLPGVKVHRGFLDQFSSLTTGADKQEDNITAVFYNLSSNATPQRVVVAGHSLGAALSELTGVWVSTVWPNASVLVANSGAPMVGNQEWVQMFRAVVGRAYRYVNHIDEVPSLPPFDSFKQVPEGMWLRNDLVLLQDRPYLPVKQLTWNDHNCETLYKPQILNATQVTVPGFIFNVSAA